MRKWIVMGFSLVLFMFSTRGVYADCVNSGDVCCDMTIQNGEYLGTCKNDLLCDRQTGMCKRDYTSPFGDKGTCNYAPRDINSSDKGCHVEQNNCNIKQGWNVTNVTAEQLKQTWPECPQCICGPIKGYALNSCRAGYNVWAQKYYVISGYNFCDDNHVPEIWLDSTYWNWNPAGAFNGAGKCRCIDKGASHSFDYVGDDKMMTEPGSSVSKSGEANQVNINGSDTKLFCEPIDQTNPKVKTAIGCLPVTINGFIGWIIPNLFGIIGGIAFLIMIYGFIMMNASDGDPKKAAAAKETITAAITGLLLSIFAIFLVRLIMLYILKLPGVK